MNSATFQHILLLLLKVTDIAFVMASKANAPANFPCLFNTPLLYGPATEHLEVVDGGTLCAHIRTTSSPQAGQA
jgi:hypothetical protein